MMGEEVSMRTRGKLKWIVVALGLMVAFIQVIRPARTNPPESPDDTVFAKLGISPDVVRILQKSCMDCHSHRTVWPWYSNVAPMSWLVIHDVNEARNHLNFSTWAELSDYRAQEKLEEICEEVREGEMPLSQYLWMHPEAELASSEIETLCAWATGHRDEIRARLEGAGEAGEPGESAESHDTHH